MGGGAIGLSIGGQDQQYPLGKSMKVSRLWKKNKI